MNALLLLAMTTAQVYAVVQDCNANSLQYSSISNITVANTKVGPFKIGGKITDDGAYEYWDSVSLEEYYEQVIRREKGVFTYEAWCQVLPGEEVGYTFFKPAIEHGELIAKLAECRTSDSDVAILTSVWSLQPTEILCR